MARVLAENANTHPVELRLTSRFAMSPAQMRSLVRVAPHEDNRRLRIVVDSPDYYRASEIDLDGMQAPLNHYFAWSELPAGSYSIVVTVLGANGPPRSSELPFEVLGPGRASNANSGANLCRRERHDSTSPFGNEPTGDAARDLQAVCHPVQDRLLDGPVPTG